MATLSAVEDAASHRHSDLRALTLAAIGVVYGDIGTSPLYTMREAFGHAGGLHLGRAPVLPPRPGPAASPPDRARHAGHGHRLAGGDLGGVLAHPPGGPARPPVADDDPAHLRDRGRADLHPARELDAHRRR